MPCSTLLKLARVKEIWLHSTCCGEIPSDPHLSEGEMRRLHLASHLHHILNALDKAALSAHCRPSGRQRWVSASSKTTSFSMSQVSKHSICNLNTKSSDRRILQARQPSKTLMNCMLARLVTATSNTVRMESSSCHSLATTLMTR
jgi:hypothetical protein